MARTRGRLHGIVLVPLLLGLFGGDDPSPPSGGGRGSGPVLEKRDQGTVELTFPAERRRPVPSVVPGTAVTAPAAVPAVSPSSSAAEPERSIERVEGSLAIFSGRVLDEVTGAPVAGARVSLPEVDLHAVTDADGRFELRGIEPREGSYEVLVSRSTYKSAFADETFRAGERVRHILRLRPLGW